MLNRRLQVLIDDERWERLQRRSTETGASVGELVRRAIDDGLPVSDQEREADLTLADARTALELFARHERLQARDAVFAAVALERDIGHILSPDRAFDAVPELVGVDPMDSAPVEALTG